MADYKDYIVNYSINANTAAAAEGIDKLAASAKAAAEWLKPIQMGMNDIARRAKVLSASANTRFTPTIDTATFNSQLRLMVGEVEKAANEMRAAINSALRGTDKKVGPIQQVRQGATRSFEEQMAGKTKSEIAAIQKAARAKLSAITKADGLLAMTRRGLAQYPTSTDLQAKERAYLKDVARLEDEIKRLEELKKTAPRVKAKATPASATTTISTPTVQKPAAIDTAFLKQWDKMFGKSKSTTLQISANPSKALEAITTVLKGLEGLHAKSSFTITPLLNSEAFTAAKTQLSALAKISGRIATPFGAANATSKGQKKDKAASRPLVVDVVGNVTSITPPKTELIVPVVGEMTKLQNKISEAIPVNVKISQSSITESIKSIKNRPTIPANLKLIWEKGAIGRQEQLKGIQSKIPPIKLTLDPTQAIAKLEEFIALIKSSSPQNIALTASGSSAGAGGKTGKASAGNVRKAEALRAKLHNSLLPFGLNKSQMDVVKQYRRFFEKGKMASGITPVAGMPAAQMMQYLNAVSMQMQAANVPMPIQLRDYINKLDKSMASRGSAIYGRGSGLYAMANQKPFFDRARKWAYPFTGQTSFGARTPMAVDMAKGMGVMFAIGGAMSAIGNSFSQAMEYQNTMKTTQAILQNGTSTYSQSNFRYMEELVREVGVKTKFSAPEVANAARFLAMAGFDINAINHSIRPIADLALIGDLDLGETADKMTNIMTTFGIKPALMRDAANIMTSTATRSNTDLMMLAESAKYGGGMARLYGSSRENPLENFAETMAIFGVMGNAGVQGSSAGTALRMMYMNLFNPNKKQQQAHNQLLDQYGISMYADADKTKRRSMADIIQDIAAKVPQEQMADLVSKLFRITATSGASAVLQAAEVDPNMAQQTLEENEAIIKQFTKDNQFSQLAALIKANVESIGGNVSGSIAEEKQNTIQGLTAQVTSTFTEGIVKAFEQRQGGFESILKDLRDYLAKPETVQMLQNLLDMVIEIGKVLAWFVGLWAEFYSSAPGLIQFWIKWQMIFTQIGSLIAPVVALIGVFNRLRGAITWLTGVSSVGATSMSRAAVGGRAANAAANAAMYAPLVVGSGRKGRPVSIRGNFAARTRQRLANNAILAGELALSGADLASTRASLDSSTRNQATAVRNRTQRIYGAGPRIARAFRGGKSATLSVASLAPMFGGLGKLFTGLLAGMAKAVGLLCSPIGLVTIATTGLGFGLYKLYQFATGNTEAQIRAQQEMADASTKATKAMHENYKWFTDEIDKWKHPESLVPERPLSEDEAKRKLQDDNFKKEHQDFYVDLTKNASKQKTLAYIQAQRDRVNQNVLYRWALGDEYDSLLGSGISDDKYKLPTTGLYNDGHIMGAILTNGIVAPKQQAKKVQQQSVRQMFLEGAATDPRLPDANLNFIKLRQQYFDNIKNGMDQQAAAQKYKEQTDKIINEIVRFDGLQSDKGMSWETYNETIQSADDMIPYQGYQHGLHNILLALRDGKDGSIVAKMNAYNELKQGIEVNTDKWWNAIAQVIGDFPITVSAMTEKGVQVARGIVFSMKDGHIDYQDVVKQIEDQIGQFERNLQTFADIRATIYIAMAKAGLMTMDDAKQMVKEDMVHAHITKEEAKKYYATLPESHPWKVARKTASEYADFLTGNETVQLGGHTFKSWRERAYVRRQLAERGFNEVVKATQATQDNANNLTGNVQTSTTTQAKPQSNTTTPTDNITTDTQDAYASHYEKGAAKATVVNINIGELAHFSDTKIASNAEERDLIDAMEPRVAEMIHRLSIAMLNGVSGGYTA